ncbi:MAG: hypothetical protein WBD56_17950, partial [Anaerolineales bacterium]
SCIRQGSRGIPAHRGRRAVHHWSDFRSSIILAEIALILSATALNTIPIIGTALSYVLPFVVAFVAGAMIVVALKELFQTARK